MRAQVALAKRVSHISYEIRDIVRKAREVQKTGKKIIWMNIGDPNQYGFSPPVHITRAIHEALNDPKYSGYCPSEGDPELREAVAKAQETEKSRVFITSGLSEGIDFLFQSLLNPGDNILLPSPGYPLYNTKSRVLGGRDNFYCCSEDYLPSPEDIRKKINEKTRAIVVINPNNPTGAVYPRSLLQEIANIAGEHNLPIIADEIYDHLVLDGAPSINLRSLTKDVPLISGNGISKNFLYPGARVGWLAFSGEGTDALEGAIQKFCNQRLSVNWEMQRGALAAITTSPTHLEETHRQLLLRRDSFMKGISSIPSLHCPIPHAAFYTFVKVNSPKFRTDKEFVYSLLDETGVLVVPGSAFSPTLNGNYFRATFLPPPEEITEAFEKMGKFLKEKG
ncbi:hypothetical protein AUJ17_03525 [Candidatus Micrarchaeota archaeon CG1_02_47_40]|nr:MAG: hypothetical protein AUJ17_03525 [Candidatus Micrarchaeota archaeon CG1_02_47_40]